MPRLKLPVILTLLLTLCSCSYMKGALKQAQYAQTQQDDPSQHNLKHMIDRQTFFVYGLIEDPTASISSMPLAVAAFSSQYRPHELVDMTNYVGVGTHYALNLPAGEYDLLLLADRDHDSLFGQSDVVGRRRAELTEEALEQMVLTDFHLSVNLAASIDWPIEITVPPLAEIPPSLFYPQGTVRTLDDSIFDPEISTLGMYEPAAFLEFAPTMFYALEDYQEYKVPVIFVHGINGTVRDFSSIIARLDRDRYAPWFFYYPSGSDLGQLAENFYAIFLSGRLHPRMDMPMIVVAHSMGGLIARQAMNLVQGEDSENRVELLITIASPLGGHPSAARSEKFAPLVLPSWRDLNPNGDFISQLYQRPLPPSVNYHLLYAYGDPATFKVGDNGDGVVPLSSQLYLPAQEEATTQFGFDCSHTGTLHHPESIEYIISAIGEVKNPTPESHLRILLTGGFDVDLDDSYSDRQKYFIRSVGRYLRALASGELEPIHPDQERFILVAHGRAEPSSFIEEAWSKLIADHPEILVPDEGDHIPQ